MNFVKLCFNDKECNVIKISIFLKINIRVSSKFIRMYLNNKDKCVVIYDQEIKIQPIMLLFIYLIITYLFESNSLK